ncbi:MAG: DUF4349 domain-containing protein [Actinomycetota bacterium]|nr:DUF4349 domain-containing protein [Actinomycetota bacterium]
MRNIRRSAGSLLAGLVITALVGACAEDGSGAADVDAGSGGDAFETKARVAELDPAPAARAAYGQTTGGGAVQDASAGGGGSAVAQALQETPEIGPSVIKTADMSLEVERGAFQDSVRDAIAVAGTYGGFVLSTSVDDERRKSGSVTIRVPAEDFEAALADLEELGSVETQTVTGRDVSQEFIDLEARIRNYEAQEVVLLRLMDRATTVVDTIRVQRELQSIQLEIERLKGRLRFLRNQAAMSTISVGLFEAGAPPSGPPKLGMLGRAWERAMSVALGVVSAVIVGTGAIVPVALLLALAYLVLRALRPRMSSS